jgi:putative ABC transport system permease protein
MTGDRWFHRLLRLLPLDFRADYGEEMARTFRDERREAAGLASVLRIWLRTTGAVLAIGPREHASQLWQDIRYALRGMRRNASFVAVAVMTLALGIGANAAVFSVVDAVLLRPLPYAQPESLVAVWNRWDGSPAAALSNPEYMDYAERSRSTQIAASAPASANLGGAGGDPERVQAAFITANTFDVLGAPPQLGRAFRPEEEASGTPAVAMLSDDFWRRRFQAHPSIIGTSVVVNGVPTEIVGVSRARTVVPFEIGSATTVDILLPLTLDRAAPRNRRGGHYLSAFARLTSGTSLAAAQAEMDGIIASLARDYPDQHDQGHFGIVVRSLREDRLGDSRPVLVVLLGAVSLVLLIACANVANLMLARSETRRREMAVRAALGASRLRIVRQLLTESLVLASAGAGLGLLVAWLAIGAIVTIGAAALPRMTDVEIKGTVLVFTALLAIGTSVLVGLVPAIQMSRNASGSQLKSGDRGSTGRSRLRQMLVVSQTAIAVVLLVAAGLLVKSFIKLTSVPSGMQSDRVLTTRVTLPATRYPDRSAITTFFAALLTRVRVLPGVRSAGAASGLPLAVASGDWGFDIEGRGRVNGRRPGAADWFVVTPGYFETLGIPLRRGRLPNDADTSDAAPVVFINEASARAIFANTDPIGKRIRLSQTTGSEQPWRTIVGIVGDVRHRGLDTPPRTEMYIPDRQFLHFSAGVQARALSVVIKTEQDPTASVAAVRAAVRAIDPDVPAAQVRTMSTIVSASVADRRLNMLLIGAFGVLALALASIGLYGVMAYAVTQRTREMGVRLAIGASRASVLSLVVGNAMRLVTTGVAIGLVLSLVAMGSLARLLFEVGPGDASVYVLVPLILLLTAGLASYLPARRATRVDPLTALRAE